MLDNKPCPVCGIDNKIRVDVTFADLLPVFVPLRIAAQRERLTRQT